jgi:CO/xanthine dehydrogenase Mo-binding subunit
MAEATSSNPVGRFGIGAAVEEAIILDPRFGCFVNHDLAEYHVPVHADVLNVDAIFLPELDAESNPLKSEGIGDLGIGGAGASIANAIYNACGRAKEALAPAVESLTPATRMITSL